MPRVLTVIVTVLLLLVAAALVAVGWVMSNRFLIPTPYGLQPEFEVVGVEEARPGVYAVRLPVREEPAQFQDVRIEGEYGLLWEGGHGRLGPVTEDAGETVVRELHSIVGEAPAAGAPARVDVTVFRGDPLVAHGLEFEELELQGEAGKLYAWWIEADPRRAVLQLHGRRRADRSETLRAMPTLVESGYSVMSLAYRNHDRSDPSPDGYFHYGQSESEDALTALAELRRRGVEQVVIYGYSMGGAVALETVKRWPAEGPELLGIIMDAPLLDPATVFGTVAAETLPVPGLITRVALIVGGLRAGIDWAPLDQRRFAPDFDVPVLLIAGTADSTIPIGLVDEFAERVEAPLEYLRLDGVEHVEGWNRQRERYERAVAGFLQSRRQELAAEEQ